MIPISHRNGEVSEKAGSGCPGDEFLGLVKGWLGAGGTLWEKNRARRARLGQTDVYLQPPEGYKTNSGLTPFRYPAQIRLARAATMAVTSGFVRPAP